MLATEEEEETAIKVSEKGLDAAEKQPAMSSVPEATNSSPLGLGLEPVRRRDDHLLGNDLDLWGRE